MDSGHSYIFYFIYIMHTMYIHTYVYATCILHMYVQHIKYVLRTKWQYQLSDAIKVVISMKYFQINFLQNRWHFFASDDIRRAVYTNDLTSICSSSYLNEHNPIL